MPKKRSVNAKSRSRKPKPRQKQKQKQKQVQKVSVSVSGGGSGSGGFIPIPQAPSFDYAALASLIRPAATVDVPIAAQAAVQATPNRPAPPIPVGSSIESRFASEPMRESFSASSAKAASKHFIATPHSSDFPSGILGRYQIPPIDVRGIPRQQRASFMEEEFNPEQEFIISKPKAKRQSIPSEK